jgi:hypothetical protein
MDPYEFQEQLLPSLKEVQIVEREETKKTSTEQPFFIFDYSHRIKAISKKNGIFF